MTKKRVLAESTELTALALEAAAAAADAELKASLPQIQQSLLISPRPTKSQKNRDDFQEAGTLTSAGRYATQKAAAQQSAQKPSTALKQNVANMDQKERRDLSPLPGTSQREAHVQAGNNLFMGTSNAQLTQRYKSSVKSRTANYQKFLSALPQAGKFVHTQPPSVMNVIENDIEKTKPGKPKGSVNIHDKNNKLKIKAMANRQQNKLENMVDPYQADSEHNRQGGTSRVAAYVPPFKQKNNQAAEQPTREVYSQMRINEQQKGNGFKPILKNRVTISQGRQNSSLAVRNSSVANQQKSRDGRKDPSQSSSLRRISTTSVGNKPGGPQHIYAPNTSHGKAHRVGVPIIHGQRELKDNSLFVVENEIILANGAQTTTAAGLPALARKSSNSKTSGSFPIPPMKININKSQSNGTKTTNTNTEDSTESAVKKLHMEIPEDLSKSQVRPLRLKKTQLEPIIPATTKQPNLPRSRSKNGVNRTASQSNSVKNNMSQPTQIQKSVDMTHDKNSYVTEHSERRLLVPGIAQQQHSAKANKQTGHNLRSHSLVSQQPSSPRNEAIISKATKMSNSTHMGTQLQKDKHKVQPGQNQTTSKNRTQNNSVNFINQAAAGGGQQEDRSERAKFEAFVHYIQARRRDCPQEQPLVIKDFRLGLQIGAGAFAVVKRAVHQQTKYTTAIKTYEKKNLTDKEAAEAVHREINTLSDLYHPNIMTLFEVIDQRTHVHLVMEQCMGASLYHHIKKLKDQRMPEDLCKVVIRQIIAGLAYMHKRGYAHRDLKLDNILFEQKTKTAKIIDFGFSIKVSDEPKQGKLNIFCGTPHYMDPDLVKKQAYSGLAADIWASGVILYILLVGKLPFFGEFEADLFRKIQGGKFRELPKDVGNQKLRNLFKRIFEVDASRRITAEELLSGDNWINQNSE